MPSLLLSEFAQHLLYASFLRLEFKTFCYYCILLQDLHTEPDSGKEKSVPPEISKDEEDELTLLESQENSEGPVTQADASVKKEDVLEKAREELAEQVGKSCFF